MSMECVAYDVYVRLLTFNLSSVAMVPVVDLLLCSLKLTSLSRSQVGSLLFWLLGYLHFSCTNPCLNLLAVKRGLLITEAHVMRVLPSL